MRGVYHLDPTVGASGNKTRVKILKNRDEDYAAHVQNAQTALNSVGTTSHEWVGQIQRLERRALRRLAAGMLSEF